MFDFHTGDLVEQYVDYRGPVSQFPVNVSAGEYLDLPTTGQPCATFGLHPSLEKMQTLYQAGDAAFYANVGSLVEPLTVEDYEGKVCLEGLSVLAPRFGDLNEARRFEVLARYTRRSVSPETTGYAHRGRPQNRLLASVKALARLKLGQTKHAAGV